MNSNSYVFKGKGPDVATSAVVNRIQGIGEKRLAGIKGLVTVN